MQQERVGFVGRERELEKLHGFLRRTLDGEGSVCFVTGEAGAGKTAHIMEFARRAQDTGIRVRNGVAPHT